MFNLIVILKGVKGMADTALLQYYLWLLAHAVGHFDTHADCLALARHQEEIVVAVDDREQALVVLAASCRQMKHQGWHLVLVAEAGLDLPLITHLLHFGFELHLSLGWLEARNNLRSQLLTLSEMLSEGHCLCLTGKMSDSRLKVNSKWQ